MLCDAFLLSDPKIYNREKTKVEKWKFIRTPNLKEVFITAMCLKQESELN